METFNRFVIMISSGNIMAATACSLMMKESSADVSMTWNTDASVTAHSFEEMQGHAGRESRFQQRGGENENTIMKNTGSEPKNEECFPRLHHSQSAVVQSERRGPSQAKAAGELSTEQGTVRKTTSARNPCSERPSGGAFCR